MQTISNANLPPESDFRMFRRQSMFTRIAGPYDEVHDILTSGGTVVTPIAPYYVGIDDAGHPYPLSAEIIEATFEPVDENGDPTQFWTIEAARFLAHLEGKQYDYLPEDAQLDLRCRVRRVMENEAVTALDGLSIKGFVDTVIGPAEVTIMADAEGYGARVEFRDGRAGTGARLVSLGSPIEKTIKTVAEQAVRDVTAEGS
jgi:hypothetical protein